MVKQKSQAKVKIKQKPNALGIALILSLAVNALMIVALIVGAYGESSGAFDYALVNNGISKMCSNQFRQIVQNDSKKRGDSANQQGLTLAQIDYPCSNNGASKYYQQGYDEYVSSLGLKR